MRSAPPGALSWRPLKMELSSRIAAGTADEGDGIHAHWILLLVLVSMMRHGFCGCFQGVPPLPPDVTGRVEFHPYDSPA